MVSSLLPEKYPKGKNECESYCVRILYYGISVIIIEQGECMTLIKNRTILLL
jgi:hypothetical protein